MLKGHVFKEQIFGSQIFALFFNTFLGGNNGIVDDYKNSMILTYSESNITIGAGAICIQGRLLEEDSSTTIDAGTNTLFCKLVLEIDLDKDNSESEFNQAKYKIITGELDYPILTQEDIVKNNSGVYQYELARFKTGVSGITDFADKRTFLGEALFTSGGSMNGNINSCSIIPKEDSKYNLGTTTKMFQRAYVDYLNMGGHEIKIDWNDSTLTPYIKVDGRDLKVFLVSSDNNSIKFNWTGEKMEVVVNGINVGSMSLNR